MIGISHIPHCYGNNHSNYSSNSFVLCRIESIFGKEVLWDDTHQPLTSLL